MNEYNLFLNFSILLVFYNKATTLFAKTRLLDNYHLENFFTIVCNTSLFLLYLIFFPTNSSTEHTNFSLNFLDNQIYCYKNSATYRNRPISSISIRVHVEEGIERIVCSSPG